MKWELFTMWISSLLTVCIYVIQGQWLARSLANVFVTHFQAAFTRKDLGLGVLFVFTLKSVHTPDVNKEPRLPCTVLSSFWHITSLGPDCTLLSQVQRINRIYWLLLSRAMDMCPRDKVPRGCPGVISAFSYSTLPPLRKLTQLVLGLKIFSDCLKTWMSSLIWRFVGSATEVEVEYMWEATDRWKWERGMEWLTHTLQWMSWTLELRMNPDTNC